VHQVLYHESVALEFNNKSPTALLAGPIGHTDACVTMTWVASCLDIVIRDGGFLAKVNGFQAFT
jgi:hypothetical protein